MFASSSSSTSHYNPHCVLDISRRYKGESLSLIVNYTIVLIRMRRREDGREEKCWQNEIMKIAVSACQTIVCSEGSREPKKKE